MCRVAHMEGEDDNGEESLLAIQKKNLSQVKNNEKLYWSSRR